MATTYEKIATTTLASTSATITFNSIAATWTDLRLVFVPIASTPLNADMRFNNDSTTLYSFTALSGTGASAVSYIGSSLNRIKFTEYDAFTSVPVLQIIDIFSYAGSTFKTCLINQAMDKNGSGLTGGLVGLYRSTSAITRIDLIGGSDFAIGTTATLYGIKAA